MVTRAPDEVCPVCKASSYLKRSISFLMNDKCYHRMCSACVNRMYGNGSNLCPVAGCGQKLHMRNFRQQQFEDLGVERELDVRKRVIKTFNRRQEEFDNLKEWNDYLEMVEMLVFNLVYKVDVEETEQKIKEYEEENKARISENAAKSAADAQLQIARDEAEKELVRLSREAQLREIEEERLDEINTKILQVDAMQRGDLDAVDQIAKDTARRAKERKKRLDEEAQVRGVMQGRELMMKTMLARKRGSPDVEAPFTPFAGQNQSPNWFQEQEYYENPWLEALSNDPAALAGGFFVQDYYRRSLLEAFAGLTTFIEEEKEKESPAMDPGRQRTDIMIVDAIS